MAQFYARRRRWAEAVTFQRQYLDRFKDKAHPGSDRELIGLLIEAEQFRRELEAGRQRRTFPEP